MSYFEGKALETLIEEQKITNELLMLIAKKTAPEAFKQAETQNGKEKEKG